jgi:hypothetical protein
VLTASHNGHVGEFTDPHADLDTVVQASQALEMLGEAYSSQEVCAVIKKNQRRLNELPNVAHVYNLAEIYRIYKCETIKGVPEQVGQVLKKDVEKMTKPSNLYYAYLLNEGGKGYGQTGKIENFLKDRAKSALYENFNQTDFSFGGNGFSTDSLKALSIFADLQDAASAFKPLVTTFIQKFGKQGL